jgi:hypothetical protein
MGPTTNQPMCGRFRALGAKLQGWLRNPLNLVPLMPARAAGVLIRRHNLGVWLLWHCVKLSASEDSAEKSAFFLS